jgi:hypothetical protein
MSKKLIKALKWLLAVAGLIALTLTGLAMYTNVLTAVTEEDTAIFVELGFHPQKEFRNFEQEIALIRQVQSVVFNRAPFGEGIPDYETREPADLMRFGQGLCFDRSRMFDKAFKYMGMPTRHVYMLYRQNRPFITALFTYGQPSHAVTEVKTSKGWMLVDSNTEWIGLTRAGQPVSADDVWRRYAEFERAPLYLKDPWWAIRGMYSRKGQFYGAGLPFPELNWVDFTGWLMGGGWRIIFE